MTAMTDRTISGEASHLFNFVLLVFGFDLAAGFQAFFEGTKGLFGDLHQVSDFWRLVHTCADPVERAVLGPQSDAAFLSLALMLSLVQYYVIINRLAKVYGVAYGMIEFVFDMMAAALFYFSAISLKTLGNSSFLLYDKCWLFLVALYLTLTGRSLIAGIRIGATPKPQVGAGSRESESRAMVLAIGSAGWYWVSVILMMWGFAHSRLSVPVEDMAKLVQLGSVGMVCGIAILAWATLWFTGWRQRAKLNVVFAGPMLLAIGALVITIVARFHWARWTRLLLHERHVFPWSALHLGIMFVFLVCIVAAYRPMVDRTT